MCKALVMFLQKRNEPPAQRSSWSRLDPIGGRGPASNAVRQPVQLTKDGKPRGIPNVERRGLTVLALAMGCLPMVVADGRRFGHPSHKDIFTVHGIYNQSTFTVLFVQFLSFLRSGSPPYPPGSMLARSSQTKETPSPAKFHRTDTPKSEPFYG